VGPQENSDNYTGGKGDRSKSKHLNWRQKYREERKRVQKKGYLKEE